MACNPDSTGVPMFKCCASIPLGTYLPAVVSRTLYGSPGRISAPDFDLRKRWNRFVLEITVTGDITVGFREERTIDPCTGENVIVSTQYTPNQAAWDAAGIASIPKDLTRQVILSFTQAHTLIEDHAASGDITIVEEFTFLDLLNAQPYIDEAHAVLNSAEFGEIWQWNPQCQLVRTGSGRTPIPLSTFWVSALHNIGFHDGTIGPTIFLNKSLIRFRGRYCTALLTFLSSGVVTSECETSAPLPDDATAEKLVELWPSNTGLETSDRRFWICEPTAVARNDRPTCCCPL